MKIEDEKIALDVKYNDFKNENNDHKMKIADVESNEQAFSKEIEELRNSIIELEMESKSVMNEQLFIKETIERLQKEQAANENEHKDLR